MVVVYVWIGVAVLTLVVLGGIAYGLLGAAQRLARELAGLDREVRPVLAELQEAAARAAAQAAQARERMPNGS